MVERSDGLYGTNNTYSQIEFKTSMLRSSLCDFRNAYILVKGTTSISQVQAPEAPDNDVKKWYLEIVFRLLIA